MKKIVFETNLNELKIFRKGKVREVYEVDNLLLVIASDRISAFDVIMNEPVPEKGKILSQISKFWFENTKHIISNHYISSKIGEYPEICQQYSDVLDGRSMIVKKCNPLPIEFVVRGYLAGSGWKEYKTFGTVCGIKLDSGLQENQKLPYPIFTPATKAETGHDENINFEEMSKIIGIELSNKLKDISIELYNFGAEFLDKNGIILADTKFEFGIDENGEAILIDEALTPDSSRFWLKENYQIGKSQMNFDKQVLRDYLESINWNKMPPPPTLPEEIINKTLEKYKAAYRAITSENWD